MLAIVYEQLRISECQKQCDGHGTSKPKTNSMLRQKALPAGPPLSPGYRVEALSVEGQVFRVKGLIQ